MNKKVEDIADKIIKEPVSVSITEDGYIILVISEAAMAELYEQSKDKGKVIVAVKAPFLMN